MIAECEIILQCTARERVLRIERLCDPTAVALSKPSRLVLALAKIRFEAAKVADQELRLLEARPDSDIDAATKRSPARAMAPTERDDFKAMIEALPELERLRRYERRARSRQKRAILGFVRATTDAALAHRLSRSDLG